MSRRDMITPYLYVPRHSRLIFPGAVDFVSGIGTQRRRERQAAGPRYLISDLGQFDWANGRMRLTSIHPYTDIETIQAQDRVRTGQSPTTSRPSTPPPDAEDLQLLRRDIDPYGTRKLETLGGAARKRLLREILQRERES